MSSVHGKAREGRDSRLVGLGVPEGPQRRARRQVGGARLQVWSPRGGPRTCRLRRPPC